MCTNGFNKKSGSSPELLPSIMGAFDAIHNKLNESDDKAIVTPLRRTHQSNNFANLSPCVQKILSNVPDQEISKNFSSEESITSGTRRFSRYNYRSLRSPEKNSNSRTNANLDVISPNVQKMLSNLPDAELVITPNTISTNRKVVRNNNTFLYGGRSGGNECSNVANNAVSSSEVDVSSGKTDNNNGVTNRNIIMENSVCETNNNNENCETYSKPLGSYLHTSPYGIASRTPVGRKNKGKYLQVPSESSVGTTSSTASSSEVSRPVSLTSLGSCSSSGSSNGHHQPGSAYLASAESLDSDPEPTGSQGSADSGIAEQTSISPEQRVLQEVLDTETVYVSDLKQVIEGYLDPWQSDPECPLSEHLQHLFSNIKEIYEFNRSFLEDLRKADCNPTKTANVFLQNDSGFSVYNEYCTNYPRTMEVLSELTRNEKMVPLFRERQIALGHALPLGSYLLKPVQRILKYHLLLQRLSKQCEPDHKPAVDLALTTMTGWASSINDMKRKHEHAVRVQEIQSQLYGWTGPDLTALGELIAEGTFRVVGARGRRHVFLFEKVLLLAKSKQDGALSYKSHIMCSNLMLVEQVRGEALCFQVLPFDNPRLQCTLRARSPQHKREWTLQIKRVILENYSAVIPNHARQLVMQLGQDLNESEDTSDKWSPLKLSPTPHYLERRSRVRKTRDLSNRRASSQDRSLVSLGSWRRKSEPSMIPQYNCKTMPKKICKIKKAKEMGSSSKFYTDLSDSETCDVIGESTESLSHNLEDQEQNSGEGKCCIKEETPKEERTFEPNLEKIVSDLIMENKSFQKVLNRPRRNVNSEPGPATWFEEGAKEIVSKADSLPRSFQLNEQNESKDGSMLDESLKENPDDDTEEQHENDLSSQIDDGEHPEHKIYRKSTIRFSILQRIKHILSEEQKRNNKYPLHKQGSKSMGEKIAHPDYADPQKLFINSRNTSQVNLTEHVNELEDSIDVMDTKLDMANEVLKEWEKRIGNTNISLDTGQENNSSSHSGSKQNFSLNSSQNSDSYYESILENSLTEEYVRDQNGKMVAKQDSFSSAENKYIYIHKYRKEQQSFHSTSTTTIIEKKNIKRPTKAPPPIPVKPIRLLNGNLNSVDAKQLDQGTCNQSFLHSNVQQNQNSSSSWVKTIVGRFE